jgi:hypothetical protein
MPKGSGGGGNGGRSGGGGGSEPLDMNATQLHGILSSEYKSKGVDVSYGGGHGTLYMTGKGGIDERMMISTFSKDPTGRTIIQGGKKYPFTGEGLISSLKAFEKGNKL